jgi:hypothetical protein
MAEVMGLGEEAGQGNLAVEEGDQSLAEVAVGGGLAGGHIRGAGLEPLWEEGGVIAGDAVLVGVEAGGEGGQSGATQGGGNVTAGEEGALRCQAIKVWGLDQRMAHEPVIGPGVVIRDDEDDIGLRGLGWGGVVGGGGEEGEWEE